MNDSGTKDISPTRTLVSIITAPPSLALKAWFEWRENFSGQDWDWSHVRLFSQAYCRLQHLGIAHSELSSFKPVYQLAIEKTEMLKRTAPSILNSLNAAGCQAVLLKGGALLMSNEACFRGRWIGDIDILVPFWQRDRAIETLIKEGWQFGRTDQLVFLDWEHGWPMIKNGELECDLHWHLATESMTLRSAESIWRSAERVPSGSPSYWRLSSTDLFFHLLLHGVRKGADGSGIQWICDALLMAQQLESRLDWDLLVHRAIESGTSLYVAEALRELRSYGLIKSETYIDQLELICPGRIRKWEFENNMAPAKAYHSQKLNQLLGHFFRMYFIWGQRVGRAGIVSPSRFLQYYTNSKTNWEMIKALRRLISRWSEQRRAYRSER